MDWVRLGTAELQVGDCQAMRLLWALAGSLDQPGNEQIMRKSFWEVKRIPQPCWCLFAIEWGFLCYFQGKGVPQMGCPAQRPALCLADLPERPSDLGPMHTICFCWGWTGPVESLPFRAAMHATSPFMCLVC